MANHTMLYDFETVLNTILRSQTDMLELVTKWSEMLATTPRYVEFNLSGRDAPLKVPNIQMVVDAINSRSLPLEPTFRQVSVSGQGGAATLSNGGLSFEGSGFSANYTANGIGGSMWKVADDETLGTWPPPRYWDVSAPGQVSITISPNVEFSEIDTMSDFFVKVAVGSSLKLTFHNYAGSAAADKLTLDCPTNKPAIWHVATCVRRRPGTGGTVCNGRAILMNGGM